MKRSNARRGGWVLLAMALAVGLPAGSRVGRVFAQQPRVLSGHAAMVDALAFSMDGKTLATADKNWTVLLWDLESGRPRTTITLRDLTGQSDALHATLGCNPQFLAFSPDGKTLAVGYKFFGPQLALCDTTTGKATLEIVLDDRPKAPRMVPGGARGGIMRGGPAGAALGGGNPGGMGMGGLVGTPGAAISCVAFSPDGKLVALEKYVATPSNNGIPAFAHAAVVLDAKGKTQRTMPVQKAFAGVAFPHDSQRIAGRPGADNLVTVDYSGSVCQWASNGRKTDQWELAASLRKAPGESPVPGSQPMVMLPDGTVQEPDGAPTAVHSVAFSPDGKTLAVGGQFGNVCLWDMNDHKVQRTVETSSMILSLAFSGDGKTLAYIDAGGVRLLEVQGDKPAKLVIGRSREQAYKLALSPDGKTLATLASDKEVRLWDTAELIAKPQVPAAAKAKAKAKVPARPNEPPPPSVSAERMSFQSHSGAYFFPVIAPDGHRIAIATDSLVKTWDTQARKAAWERPWITGGDVVPLPGEVGQGMLFSPDGRWLVTTDVVADPRDVPVGEIAQWALVWDASTGALRYRLNCPNGTLVAWSPDGKTLATNYSVRGLSPGAGTHGIKFWDSATGKPLADFRVPCEVEAMAFSADGKTLACSGVEIKESPQSVGRGFQKSIRGPGGIRGGMAFGMGSGSGPVSEDTLVLLWDVPGRKQTARWKVPEESSSSGTAFDVGRVFFSPDEKWLFAQGCLWDVASGQVKKRFTNNIGWSGDASNPARPYQTMDRYAAFTPDSKSLVLAEFDEHVVRATLYDLAGGESKRVVDCRDPKVSFSAMTIAPAGDVVAVAGTDRTIRLWDARTGKEFAAVQNPKQDWSFYVGFSANGKILLSTTRQGDNRVWDVPNSTESPRPNTAPDFRTWTSAGGKFTVEAQFVEVADGQVTLNRKDGTTIRVTMQELSAADQEYVRKLKGK